LTGPGNRYPDTGWRDYQAQATDQWALCETHRAATWQDRSVKVHTHCLFTKYRKHKNKENKDVLLVRLLLTLNCVIKWTLGFSKSREYFGQLCTQVLQNFTVIRLSKIFLNWQVHQVVQISQCLIDLLHLHHHGSRCDLTPSLCHFHVHTWLALR
jgi:hypothetical protein